MAFSATLREAQVLLSWKTASEQQNRGFEVQATSNFEEGFKLLAFVPSLAPTTMQQQVYSFLDQRPGTAGIRYYRLRQVDLNGEYSYSSVKAVRVPANQRGLSVYPNPFSQQLQVQLSDAPLASCRLTLRNTLGQTMLMRECTTDAASMLTLNTPETLPAGTYLLELEVAGQVFHQRLTK